MPVKIGTIIALSLAVIAAIVFFLATAYYPQCYREYWGLTGALNGYQLQQDWIKSLNENNMQTTGSLDYEAAAEQAKSDIAKIRAAIYEKWNQAITDGIQQSFADAQKWRQENLPRVRSLFLILPLCAALVLTGCGIYSLLFLWKLRKQTTKSGLYLSVITSVIFIFISPLGLISIQQGTQQSPLLLKGLIVGDIVLAIPLFIIFVCLLVSATRNTEGKAIPCRACVALELTLLSFVFAASFGLFVNLVFEGEYRERHQFRSMRNSFAFPHDCQRYAEEANDSINKIAVGLRKQSQEAIQANDREQSEKNEILIRAYGMEQQSLQNTFNSISERPRGFGFSSYGGIYVPLSLFLLLLVPLGSVGMGLGINYLTTKNTEGRVPAWFAALIYPMIAAGFGFVAFFIWLTTLNGQTAIAVSIIVLATVILIVGIFAAIGAFWRRR
ncbi:hypothetical protein FACS189454_08990 [Planctomycetales bacterium]|nr:hypothetical protein FACS189454_08990 [Planctomycetales bacterium]